MPKKVSSEYFIQLSQRVNIAQKKEKKETGLLKSPSEKGQGEIATQVKGQGTNLYMYTNQPRSIDRAYYLKNQSLKTGSNISI